MEIERIAMKCRNNNTKVITTTKLNKGKLQGQLQSQSVGCQPRPVHQQSKRIGLQRIKETRSALITIGFVIMTLEGHFWTMAQQLQNTWGI